MTISLPSFSYFFTSRISPACVTASITGEQEELRAGA